jgi:hypothetical protein
MSSAHTVVMDPLACPSLVTRFPHLIAAMDGELMSAQLQGSLFDGTRLRVTGCSRPKAELSRDTCWLQYPLQVRTPSNQLRDVLVLGTMFAEAGAAGTFERDALVPLAASWLDGESLWPRPTAAIADLELAVSVFPVNSRLPTVIDATNPRRASEALSPLLDGAGVRSVELVQFRRTRGCVLRYHSSSAEHPVIYGKVGYGAPAEVVREGLDALARSMGSIRIPRVLGHAADIDVTFVAEVPGLRPDFTATSSVDSAVDGAARIAAALHRSGVIASATRSLSDELDKARQALDLIQLHDTDLGFWLAGILDTVEAVAAETPEASPVLAHGDFTPSQLLVAGSELGILDFDKMCQAEPGFDVGRFCAYLRVALLKHQHPGGVAVSRFLEGYGAAADRQVSRARADAYEITSLVRMAARSWLQLKPSRLRTVAAVLATRADDLQPR